MMIDPMMICVYCGDTMDAPTEKQLEVFGEPECCEHKMLQVERNNLHVLLKGIETLKKNIEHELVKDQL